MEYLRLDESILLADIGLLETLGTLLPNLGSRINHLLGQIVDSLAAENRDPGWSMPMPLLYGSMWAEKQERTLRAVNAFPLHGQLILGPWFIG